MCCAQFCAWLPGCWTLVCTGAGDGRGNNKDGGWRPSSCIKVIVCQEIWLGLTSHLGSGGCCFCNLIYFWYLIYLSWQDCQQLHFLQKLIINNVILFLLYWLLVFYWPLDLLINEWTLHTYHFLNDVFCIPRIGGGNYFTPIS